MPPPRDEGTTTHGQPTSGLAMSARKSAAASSKVRTPIGSGSLWPLPARSYPQTRVPRASARKGPTSATKGVSPSGLGPPDSRRTVGLPAPAQARWRPRPPTSTVASTTPVPGEAGGLYAGDEIVAADGWKVSESSLADRLAVRRPGDTLVLNVFRRDELREVRVVLGAAPRDKWEIVPDKAADAEAKNGCRVRFIRSF